MKHSLIGKIVQIGTAGSSMNATRVVPRSRAEVDILRWQKKMMMMKRFLFTALSTAALAGCTHQQLNRSTILTTSTIMEIQYRIVLMNLAKLSLQPEALPDHMDLADGVVQVNDRLGFGQNGGFTTFAGVYGFGLDRFGPSGQRQVTEQWGADATTDPQRLVELQDLYRVALGLSPLPPPNAIVYLRGLQTDERRRVGRGANASGEAQVGPEENDSKELRPVVADAYVKTAQGPSFSVGGDTTSAPEGKSAGPSSKHVPIEILLTDVPPPGWFHLGRKKDVPRDACYVGCFGDRYAWVTADGLRGLSQFTVTVLNVIKLEPSWRSKGRGLAVTN